ncbi:MAG: electron transfer flavoprotein subunit alpha/FixB family protein [Peptoniphilaceae bacterium]|nr:electron transfer flavoprotein subunit alpha/FixB family protein [Peptoniphilaceae bacterium]MDD7383389.1 electron transfer flavoprotein subunit alpha/FixB family protein [Peptoniphilaceae bacterium]MDY3738240.1 electron transfer flavoprotein subunit alpha/FixB family protein [Peptoniphilaceae bacterium]
MVKLNKNTTDYKGVCVVTEQRDGKLQGVSLELLGKGKELARDLSCELTAILVGYEVKELANELASYGADKVILVEDEKLKDYLTEPYTVATFEAIKSIKPEIVLFGATSIGRVLAPRVASRIGAGLTADCTKLEIDKENHLLLMTRPAFGGNLMATITSEEVRPQMSTVRPGVMRKSEPDLSRKAEIINLDVNFTEEDFSVELLESKVDTKKKINIEDAEILVSVGRGIGSKENIEEAYELAEVLGATVSGSRAVVDSGWLDKDRQVGQTGKTVRPNLYIALGISGAIQHLAGMEESDLIIAVNKNHDAPIFEVADIGIVGDVHKVIPQLIKLIKEKKAKKA